ncbi:response regulator [Geoglobus acetivorans]|uniref:Signal transduction response regulator n=1 Tax=Geoglobus acetivorans TaxID=565033 RepID=A0A0A7GFE1_GEOAI|nr:Signal transduction response regulator [Geoglobus acetivorans]
MKSVLVVDDENAIRGILTIMLSGRFKIITARDGREALEKFKVFRPDFVIMDLMMPVVNGVEAIKEIRKIDSQVIIVALTAYAEQRKEELVDAGANEVLGKPFRRKELVEILQKYI